ncbi:conjugal transfer protein TrbC [Pseudomonas sp. PA-7-1E]|uniref:TrbC/VirB2 family protein n=1 Tax=unclassified Pseudomonas TaxID=196821 RepID=UPI001F1627ED|nr:MULTISPECIES: TrbC/VirB2 family protein [unclassified Pseudomonas]MCF5043272.1 conjugal transfer protein TrbC [Pseudomonas sp. PA-7-1E]MCF5131251.1 conjugal transfer protein TrbC [Pseudomonas sp. PA-6-4F]
MTANALFASPVASSAPTLASKARGLLTSPYFWLMTAVVIALLFGAEPVHAANATEGGGSGLPWEGPIAKLVQSISGPVAFGIALLGIIACGATLIWGGEISEFTRRIIYVILVVCIIVFAKNLLTGTMFSGAVIPANASITADDLATVQTGAGGR